MKYVTLDTGYKGSAILWEDTRPIEAFLFKKVGKGINVREFADTLIEWSPERIMVEIFPARPMQGVTQTSNQWRVIGQIESVCIMFCDYVEYIYVASWTSFTRRLSDNPEQEHKKISQELAKKYFPDFTLPYMTISA